MIKEGDTVSISHEAYVLTEGLLKQYEVWDSVTMIHPLAPRNGTILEVYAKALTYLHEGDEATIIVPHVLGYGRAGVKSASGQILIPSFFNFGIHVEGKEGRYIYSSGRSGDRER